MLALPIFPGRLQPSIVGRIELNFRVRDGNGWTLNLINTNYLLHCTLKTEQRQVIGKALICLHYCRSSPRAISIGQLHALLHFHLRPIYQVVFLGPYSIRMRDLILGGVSRLDAFSVYHVHT